MSFLQRTFLATLLLVPQLVGCTREVRIGGRQDQDLEIGLVFFGAGLIFIRQDDDVYTDTETSTEIEEAAADAIGRAARAAVGVP